MVLFRTDSALQRGMVLCFRKNYLTPFAGISVPRCGQIGFCQTSYPVAEVRRTWVIFFVHCYAGFLYVYLCDILASLPLFVVRMCKCCLHSGTISNSASKYSFIDKFHFQKL